MIRYINMLSLPAVENKIRNFPRTEMILINEIHLHIHPMAQMLLKME